jgi:hypothetical protein
VGFSFAPDAHSTPKLATEDHVMKDQDDESDKSQEGEDITGVGEDITGVGEDITGVGEDIIGVREEIIGDGDFRHPAGAADDADSLDGLSVPGSPNPLSPESDTRLSPVLEEEDDEGIIIIDDDRVLYPDPYSETGFVFGEELGALQDAPSDISDDEWHDTWDGSPPLFSGAANQRPPSIYSPDIPGIIGEEEDSVAEADRAFVSLTIDAGHPETAIGGGRNRPFPGPNVDEIMEYYRSSPDIPDNNENEDPAITQMLGTPDSSSNPPQRLIRVPAVPVITISDDEEESDSSDGEYIVFRPRATRPNSAAGRDIPGIIPDTPEPDSSFEQQVAASNEQLELERTRGRGRGRGGRGVRGRGRGSRGGRGGSGRGRGNGAAGGQRRASQG